MVINWLPEFIQGTVLVQVLVVVLRSTDSVFAFRQKLCGLQRLLIISVMMVALPRTLHDSIGMQAMCMSSKES
jgi:hypothetical protein